jgi:hypothetical protein
MSAVAEEGFHNLRPGLSAGLLPQHAAKCSWRPGEICFPSTMHFPFFWSGRKMFSPKPSDTNARFLCTMGVSFLEYGIHGGGARTFGVRCVSVVADRYFLAAAVCFWSFATSVQSCCQ